MTASGGFESKGRGFVLRVVQAQEADVIVRLLNSNGEKISAFARAALKSRKRFGGALEPFVQVEYRLTRRPGQELATLEEALVRQEFSSLKERLELITAASYLAELCEFGAQEGLPHRELYNLLGAGLKRLESLGADLTVEAVDSLLRHFELKWLFIMGWLPSLNACESCGAEGDLFVHAISSGITCNDCGPTAIRLTRRLQSLCAKMLASPIGSSLGGGGLDTPTTTSELRELRRVTHGLLQSHLGSHRLKSLEFLSALT